MANWLENLAQTGANIVKQSEPVQAIKRGVERSQQAPVTPKPPTTPQPEISPIVGEKSTKFTPAPGMPKPQQLSAPTQPMKDQATLNIQTEMAKKYTEDDLLETMFWDKNKDDPNLSKYTQLNTPNVQVRSVWDLYTGVRQISDGKDMMRPEYEKLDSTQRQKLAFKTVQRLTDKRIKETAAQQKKEYMADVETEFRKTLGIAGFWANKDLVMAKYDALPKADKDKLISTVDSKWRNRDILASVDTAFTKSLEKLQGREKMVEADRNRLEKEVFLKPLMSFFEGALSSGSVGVYDLVKSGVEEAKGGMEADTFGYKPEELKYEENDELRLARDAASGISQFAGMLGGGFLTYGAIAGGVKEMYAAIPGKLGKFLTETPVLSTYVFQNLGEEAVESGIRRATGQEYTFQDFMTGMVMGAAFEGTGDAIRALKRADIALVKAEEVKGQSLTTDEVQNTVLQVPYNDMYSLGNMFGEKRLAHLKGMNEGRPGIDYAAPLPKVEARIDEKVLETDQGRQAYEEFANAMAGERIVTEEGTTGMKSSFPEWVPADLRSRELFDKIEGYIATNTKPKAKKEVELYNILAERMGVSKYGMNAKQAEAEADMGFEKEYDSKGALSKLRSPADKMSFVQKKLEDTLSGGWTKKKSQQVKNYQNQVEKYAADVRQEEAVKDVKALSKNKATITDYKLAEGPKAERLRNLTREVAKRQAMEADIAKGEYAPAQARAESGEVRKSGGISQSMINGVDLAVGKVTEPVGKAIVKAADMVTPEVVQDVVKKAFKEYGTLPEDVAGVFREYKRGVEREKSNVTDMIDALYNTVKTSGSPEEIKPQILKYLQTGDPTGLSKEVEAVTKPIAEEVAIEGLRQVMKGDLEASKYVANMGTYLRRLYGASQLKEFEFNSEKYNTLKNKLLDSGWDGEASEKFITDLQLGQIETSDLSKFAKAVNAKDPFKGGGVRAEEKTVSGGFLRERVLGDDDLSMAVRDFLGEIKDPVFLAQKTLLDLKKSRLNSQLWKGLYDIGMIKEKIMASEAKEWEKIAGDSFGKEFNGYYIQKGVKQAADSLNSAAVKDAESKFVKATHQFNSFIKQNLTVFRLGGQFKNFTSNLSTSRTLLGHNFMSISGVKELIDASKEFSNKGEFYQELKAYGRLGGTIKKEIFLEMEDAFKGLDTTKPANMTEALQKKWRAIEKKFGDVYEYNDFLYLMANYKKLRAKGDMPLDALAKANKVTPNYDEISPFLKKIRSSIIGVPFVTWRAKVYPEIVKQMFKTPVRATQALWGTYAAMSAMTASLDPSERERAMIDTKFKRDGKIPIGRDAKGNIIFVNYMEYTPFADMFKGGYKKGGDPASAVPDVLYGYVSGALPVVGSFPAQLAINLQANYDPFLKKPISKNEPGSAEYLMDYAAYLAPSLVPVFGGSYKSVGNVLSGKSDVTEGLIDALTGVRVDRLTAAEFEKYEKYKDADYGLTDAQKEIKEIVPSIVSNIAGGNPEQGQKDLDALIKKHPESADYIDERIGSALKSEKSKRTAFIKTEVAEAISVLESNPDAGVERIKTLMEENPDQADVIDKQIGAELKRLGVVK